MIKLFNKIKAECTECGTPLNGDNLLKRGNKYYCQSDYERLSPKEKIENKRIKDESEFIQKILETP